MNIVKNIFSKVNEVNTFIKFIIYDIINVTNL